MTQYRVVKPFVYELKLSDGTINKVTFQEDRIIEGEPKADNKDIIVHKIGDVATIETPISSLDLYDGIYLNFNKYKLPFEIKVKPELTGKFKVGAYYNIKEPKKTNDGSQISPSIYITSAIVKDIKNVEDGIILILDKDKNNFPKETWENTVVNRMVEPSNGISPPQKQTMPFEPVLIIKKNNNSVLVYSDTTAYKFVNQLLEIKGELKDKYKEQPKTNTNNTKDNIKTTPAIWDSLQLASKRAQYLTIIGAIGGSAFAYYKKSSIWGYVGYAALFSFGGSLLALASVKFIPLKTKTTPNNTNSNSTNNSELTDLYVKMVNMGGQPKAIADLPKNKLKFNQFENLLSSQEKLFIKDYFNGLLKLKEDIKNKTPEQSIYIMGIFNKNITDKYGETLIIEIKTKAKNLGLELFA